MREVFHGWRKKVGSITLAMACLLMAGWVRSLVVIDLVDLRWTADSSATESLLSMEGCLGWLQCFQQENAINALSEAQLSSNLTVRFPAWRSHKLRGMNPLPTKSRFETPVAQWCWRQFRIGAGAENFTIAGGGFYREKVWAIPYWLMVTPLTVLSAYLILWKPREPVNHDA